MMPRVGIFLLKERSAFMPFPQLIKEKYGNQYKLPLMKSPKFMLYLVGWMFGQTIKFIKRNVEHPIKLNVEKAKESLD